MASISRYQVGTKARLDELAEARAAPDELIDRLRAGLQARIGNTRARAGDNPVPQPSALTEQDVRGALLAAENAELTHLYDEGAISAATRRQFQQALDLESARLSDE
jgi:monovalent cation/hydrogen antiporter